METTATASNWHLLSISATKFGTLIIASICNEPFTNRFLCILWTCPTVYMLDVGSLGTLRLEVDVLPETKKMLLKNWRNSVSFLMPKWRGPFQLHLSSWRLGVLTDVQCQIFFWPNENQGIPFVSCGQIKWHYCFIGAKD